MTVATDLNKRPGANESEYVLGGLLTRGLGWATSNWGDVVIAHANEVPDLASYVPGTLNLNLVNPTNWTPPHDDEHRMKSILQGRSAKVRDTPSRLLSNGNYFHPTLKVVQIAGIAVEGIVYYPGCANPTLADGTLRPVERCRIEVCSRVRLRELLGLPAGQDHRVEVRIVDIS